MGFQLPCEGLIPYIPVLPPPPDPVSAEFIPIRVLNRSNLHLADLSNPCYQLGKLMLSH